ncbi:hypothetical protein BD408DRAFT_234621 [Parasitella parasitica]|nr:hypothetical protein BD408DRAFT_234621 [Parasitella parasitica]
MGHDFKISAVHRFFTLSKKADKNTGHLSTSNWSSRLFIMGCENGNRQKKIVTRGSIGVGMDKEKGAAGKKRDNNCIYLCCILSNMVELYLGIVLFRNRKWSTPKGKEFIWLEEVKKRRKGRGSGITQNEDPTQFLSLLFFLSLFSFVIHSFSLSFSLSCIVKYSWFSFDDPTTMQ